MAHHTATSQITDETVSANNGRLPNYTQPLIVSYGRDSPGRVRIQVFIVRCSL